MTCKIWHSHEESARTGKAAMTVTIEKEVAEKMGGICGRPACHATIARMLLDQRIEMLCKAHLDEEKAADDFRDAMEARRRDLAAELDVAHERYTWDQLFDRLRMLLEMRI